METPFSNASRSVSSIDPLAIEPSVNTSTDNSSLASQVTAPTKSSSSASTTTNLTAVNLSMTPQNQHNINNQSAPLLLNSLSGSAPSKPASTNSLPALPNFHASPASGKPTVSRPNRLAFKFDEFMALLSGKNIDQLLLEVERTHDVGRLNVLRMSRQLLSQNPCYFSNDVMRRRFEIAFIKISVLQRIITSVRESHRMLGQPLDVQQLDITAEWAACSAIVPLFWNYRIMTVPMPPKTTLGSMDPNNSFANDAFYFGLLLAESLLCNRLFDRVTIRERVVTHTVTLNGRYRVNKSLSVEDSNNLRAYLQNIANQREFSMANVLYDPDLTLLNRGGESNTATVWLELITLIFKLTTRIPGFSYYHSSNSQDKQVVSTICQNVTQLAQSFKTKLSEPTTCDVTIAALLQDILQP